MSFPLLFPLTFASSAFVPVSSMPSWLQGFATYQPVSVTVTACRALMIGGPTATWVIQSLLWSLGSWSSSSRSPSAATAPAPELRRRWPGSRAGSRMGPWLTHLPPRPPLTPSAPAATCPVGDTTYEIYRINALADRFDVARLPYSIKVVLENLLRHEDGVAVRPADIEAVAGWGDHPERHGLGRRGCRRDRPHPRAGPHAGLHRRARRGRPGRHARRARRPRRRPGQGQPAGPGRAGHRPLGHRRGVGRARRPTTRTSTSSTSATSSATSCCAGPSRPSTGSGWCRPGTGICHQVNLEYLSRVVFATDDGRAYCDTLVGTDSHTTMVNGLGVLGWGVGGIEAEAAMLGQPLSMLLPPVVGLPAHRRAAAGHHRHRPGADHHPPPPPARRGGQVRRVLRPGRGRRAAGQPGHHRQHVARVRRHLRHLPHRRGHPRLPALHRTRRPPRGPGRGLRQGAGHVPHGRRRRAGLLRDHRARPRPPWCRASPGPSRPQDLVTLAGAGGLVPDRPRPRASGRRAATLRRRIDERPSGTAHVVVAAITSCTNTSNPQVMVAAGLVARGAVDRGLDRQAVGQDHPGPGLAGGHGLPRPGRAHRAAGRASGSTWSASAAPPASATPGPLLPGVSEAVHDGDLSVAVGAVGQPELRGPDPSRRPDELPGLAAAGGGLRPGRHHGHRPHHRSAGQRTPTGSRSTWPTCGRRPRRSPRPSGPRSPRTCSASGTASVFDGDERWQAVETATGDTFSWDHDSTYVLRPTFLEGLTMTPGPGDRRDGARVLAKLGRQRDHRPHLAGRQHQPVHARPATTCPTTASTRPTSTPTGPAGATTR